MLSDWIKTPHNFLTGLTSLGPVIVSQVLCRCFHMVDSRGVAGLGDDLGVSFKVCKYS